LNGSIYPPKSDANVQMLPHFADARRIAVIGCAGAGKSTLAARIHALTGIRLVRLDDLFLRPASSLPTLSERRDIVARLAKTEEWIMDGNDRGTYDLRLPLADVVVFLDPGLHWCLLNLCRRALRERFIGPDPATPKTQAALPLALVRHVLRFHRQDYRKLVAAVRGLARPGRLVTLTSRREVETWFNGPNLPSR
jgi:adenylate kinase family enzyme